MITLSWIIISTFIISLLAFLGVLTLALREKLLEKILFFLVALAAGVLMGGAFLHLIPEALEETDNNDLVFFILIAGFLLFFLLEKILYWRHCHKGKCEAHPFGYLSLLGDGIHNFIDGLVIGASFLADFKLGITTSLIVASHEIPQEISDFGILVFSGFKKSKALLLNFLVATTVILGGLVSFFFFAEINQSIVFLLPLAAGGFLYVAAVDLLPSLKEEIKFKKSLATFLIFILGVAIMYLLK